MKTYKAIIVAPGGSRAYMNFEAKSLKDAKLQMDFTFLLTLVTNGGMGSIESVEETTEPVTDGVIVTEWGPGEDKGPLPFPI